MGMVHGSISKRPSLKQWPALAFVIAGVARVGNAVLTHFATALGIPSPEWATSLTILLAFSAALVGLLGIYSWISPLSPRLSSVGLLAVGITLASIIASLIGKYIVGGESPQGILLIIPVSFYIFSMLSFLVFGIASFRTGVPSHTVGILIVTVGISRLVTLAGRTEIGTVFFVLPVLGIGYLLRTTSFQSMIDIPTDETAV